MERPTNIARLKELSNHIATCVNNLVAHGDDRDDSDPIYRLRVQLLDSLTEAQQLLTSGPDFIGQLASQNNQFHCIRWLLRFNILSLVPLPLDADGINPSNGTTAATIITTNDASLSAAPPSIPFAQVAKQANVPEHQLRRISRMAMLRGFLCEPVPGGRLAHTPLSADFARSDSLSAWGRFVTDISAPMVTKMVEATERWGRGDDDDDDDDGDDTVTPPSVNLSSTSPSLPANATAYNIAWSTDLPFFQHIKAEPELGKRYSEYLRHMNVNKAVLLDHLVKAFPLVVPDAVSPTTTTLVVDVGGGLGQASFALTTTYPHLRCLVQDLPETVARAEAARAASNSSDIALGDSHLQDAVAFEAHDFFKPQPAGLPDDLRRRWGLASSSLPPANPCHRDVDVFLLRQIIHDWQDSEAAAILRNLLPRLKPGGRIVVMDTVLPDQGSDSTTLPLSRAEEMRLRVRDLTMMQTYNARERDLVEWKELLAETDAALSLSKVVTPTGSDMAVLEIVVKEFGR